MSKRMLIDASHPEETRVVVLDGQKVEEFDFESATKRPLKGNIYLAKVTRVEPSLQAAFVEYGGNRQGFLAFSEIHPDYYQIPIADRQALLAEQEAEARREAAEDFEAVETGTAASDGDDAANGNGETDDRADARYSEQSDAQEDDAETSQTHSGSESSSGENPDIGPYSGETEAADSDVRDSTDEQPSFEGTASETPERSEASHGQDDGGGAANDDSEGGEASPAREQNGDSENGHDQREQAQQASRPSQRWTRRKHYKIQEVIKRRQIILVQVVKEERGTKGAALTTYMSLAGRYCVLMPNTPRGGGISRKITNATDRARLKSAAASLELPEGMGVIIRTAGESRTKTEIKRDYEYLLRLWDQIRETTLGSNAPACVHEEGDLIKRAIRDLYNKDVSEIVVEGDDGYRNAKDFMRMLMPSHAKNVKPYKEHTPLFQGQHIEAQLDAMFQPTVTLKSGGYIVIDQTEALVSIDVNSGRATREHSIEDTATKTNLEAADEIGRQLRLRDLAGLIVIDFIDMEDSRNDRAVEKRLANAVKNDRARVQVGKISQFGLMEMSRQRLRAGVVAGSTVPCPHCNGQGLIRSVESTALRLLRAIEEEGQKHASAAVCVKAPTEIALYTLNQKRRELARIENEYEMAVQFAADGDAPAGSFEIAQLSARSAEDRARLDAQAHIAHPPQLPAEEESETEIETVAEDVQDVTAEAEEERAGEQPLQQNGNGEGAPRRRRRRRGGRGRSSHGNGAAANGNGNGNGVPHAAQSEHAEPSQETSGETETAEHPAVSGGEAIAADGVTGENGEPRRKRRRRRGGRGRSGRGQSDAQNGNENGNGNSDQHAALGSALQGGAETPAAAIVPNGESAPVWSLTPQAADPSPREAEPSLFAPSEPAAPQDIPAQVPIEQSMPQPQPERVEPPQEKAPVLETAAAIRAPEEPAAPPRKGWWQRPFRAKD